MKVSALCGNQRPRSALRVAAQAAFLLLLLLLPVTFIALHNRLPSALPPRDEQKLYAMKSRISYADSDLRPAELDLVLRHLLRAASYIEWGAGASTFNFPQFVSRALSIEHRTDVCSSVRKRLDTATDLDHLRFVCRSVNPAFANFASTGDTDGDYRGFRRYVDVIDDAGIPLYDFVYIDGRARVDCAIKVLSYIHSNSTVVFHDASRFFVTDRYVPALAYYDILDSIGGDKRQGVVVLRRKEKLRHLQGDHEAVQYLLLQRHNLTS